ncbi:uncharacterized protein LOC143302043 [Babylonia areolata]|uniref:uncharacterized protein LOC143302043 n=1 Tax=Babylonia areolata TaxID=304850 RepID=UPI003FCF2747
MDLNSLQESYLKGLRQMTGGGQTRKKMAEAPIERPGLGSKAKKQSTGKEYAYYSRGDQLKSAFDVSNKAVLASFFFWLLLMYGLYTLGGYLVMGLRVMWNDADLQGDCQTHFSVNREENLHSVMDYPKGDAGPYIARFASDRGISEDYPADSKSLPPLVTAVSSPQFFLLQAFIQHVHQGMAGEHKDIKLIVYDVGLYKREKEILQQYCACEVRTMEYSLYPDHVADTSNFAWRPILIQSLLEEFGAVMYVDVSTRFKTSNSLNMVRSRGHNHFLLWDTAAFTSTTAYTNKQTFHFLNESRCLFSDVGLVDSQVMVFYRTNHTWHSLMKPWLKCALNADCLAPRWSHHDGCLHYRRPKTTGCHRYDLSALSIILNRGQQLTAAGHANHYTPPRFVYVSEEEAVLFPEQPWTNGQLALLVGVPCLLAALVARKQVHRCLSASILKER